MASLIGSIDTILPVTKTLCSAMCRSTTPLHVDELDLDDYPYSPANLYKKDNNDELPVGLNFTGFNARKALAPRVATFSGNAAMARANAVKN